MPKFKEQCYSDYSVEQLASLVLDVVKYPEFLPWCSNAIIITQDDQEMLVDMTISYGGFSETYRSLVKFSVKEDCAEIEAVMVEGPFQYLENRWIIKADPAEGAQLDFFVDFELKSSLLNKALSIFFFSACKKMSAAFEKRADELFNDE
jgi:coenzyme Q-binding protein COQ10